MSILSWAWRATLRSGMRKGVRDGVFGRDKSSLAIGALVGGVKLLERLGDEKPAEVRSLTVEPGSVIEVRHGPVPASNAEMRRLRARARRLLRDDVRHNPGTKPRGRKARRVRQQRFETELAQWDVAVADAQVAKASGRKRRKLAKKAQRAHGVALVATARRARRGGDPGTSRVTGESPTTP